MTFRNGENCWALVSDRSRRICFWYRHVKAIECDRDETVKAHQIDELRSTMRAECLNGLAVGQLGQRAMINKRRSHVIGDRLFAVRSLGR